MGLLKKKSDKTGFAVIGLNKGTGEYDKIATGLEHWTTAIQVAKKEIAGKKNPNVQNYGLKSESKSFVIRIEPYSINYAYPDIKVEPYQE